MTDQLKAARINAAVEAARIEVAAIQANGEWIGRAAHQSEYHAVKDQLNATVAAILAETEHVARLTTDAQNYARMAITAIIESISGDMYAARWDNDIEFCVWDAISTESQARLSPLFASLRFSARGAALRWLSDISDGWVTMDAATGGTRFVPLAEWRAIYAGWKDKAPKGAES